MPTRGKARKIGIRVEAKPVSSARQNGELAASANRIGTCTRMPLAMWIALSASSIADVDVQPEDDLLARDEAQRGDQLAVARVARRPAGPPTARTGACPPSRSAGRAGPPPRPPSRRSARSCSPAAARVRVRGGGDLEHRLEQLGLDLARRPPYSSSTASIALASANVSASRIISSSSMPIVKLGPVNFGSIGRVQYEASQADTTFEPGEAHHGARLRRQALHPRLRPPGLVPEEDVRDRGRARRRGDGRRSPTPSS